MTQNEDSAADSELQRAKRLVMYPKAKQKKNKQRSKGSVDNTDSELQRAKRLVKYPKAKQRKNNQESQDIVASLPNAATAAAATPAVPIAGSHRTRKLFPNEKFRPDASNPVVTAAGTSRKRKPFPHEKFRPAASNPGATTAGAPRKRKPFPHEKFRTPTNLPNNEERTVDCFPSEQFTAVAAEVDLEQEVTARVEERLKHLHTEDSIRNNILREAQMATVVSPSGEEEEGVNALDNTTSNQCKKRTKYLTGIGLFLLLLALLLVSITWGILGGDGGTGDRGDGGIGAQNGKKFELENDTILATVPETICYERIPLMGRSVHCLQPQVLGSGVTNLVAQAFLWKFPQAEISIVYAGEATGDIVAGDLTGAMAKLLLPWSNTLVILRIKGFDLVRELERLIHVLHGQNNTPGALYPYGAGIRYWVNMTEEFPDRLSKVQVNQRLAEAEWEPIDFEITYTVVTDSYLANGGGFSQVVLASKGWNDTHVEVLPAFVEFCQEHEVLLDPPRDQYSTQSYTHNPSLFDLYDGVGCCN